MKNEFFVYGVKHYIESKVISLDETREQIYIKSSLNYRNNKTDNWNPDLILLKGSAQKIADIIINNIIGEYQDKKLKNIQNEVL